VTFSTERLREIAKADKPVYCGDECELSAFASELLATREQIAAVCRNRDDLLELARLDNEAAHEAVLSGRDSKFKFGAMTTRDAVAELVQQRDTARAELAEARRQRNEVVDPNLPHLESHPKHEKAARERDAAQERVDLDIDEFRRIKAELDNLRVGLPPLTEDSARSLYAVVAGICERAVTAGRQRVPLIVQRDKAEAERDAARAELAALHARIEQSHNGYQEDGKELGLVRPASHLVALGELLAEQCDIAALMARQESGDESLRAELAEARQQRDELVREIRGVTKHYVGMLEGRTDERGDGGHTVAVRILNAVEVAIAEIAAEQPKRAEQLPKGPTHGRFTDDERAELDDLKRKAFEAAKPQGGAS